MIGSFLFLTGMTVALAPFNYLVHHTSLESLARDNHNNLFRLFIRDKDKNCTTLATGAGPINKF
jgi:hypothetical protein